MQYGEEKRIVFVGKDGRLGYAMRSAAEYGYACRLVRERIPARELSGDLLVLPVPALRNGLYDEDELVTIGTAFRAVAGGMLPKELVNRLSDAGTKVFDYTEDEEYVRKNAVVTAQLAIGILTAHTESAICDLKIAVLGDGRIGTALKKYLSVFGGEVRLYSRKGTPGTHPYEELPAFLAGTDFLINTVPAPVVRRETLRDFPAASLAIELAGNPGGFSEDAEDLLGKRLLRAPGLPGKYAPESAGTALWRAILRAELSETENVQTEKE